MVVLGATDFLKAKRLINSSAAPRRWKDGKLHAKQGGKWIVVAEHTVPKTGTPKKENASIKDSKPTKRLEKKPAPKKPEKSAALPKKKAHIEMPVTSPDGMWLKKLTWDTKPCSRCGGSGHHSYNPAYGTMCFKCQGSGQALTPAASKSQVKFNEIRDELRKVPASSVKVGDTIKIVDKYRVVTEIKKDMRGATFNGVPLDYITFRAGGTGFSTAITSNVMKLVPWTAEAVATVNELPGIDTVIWEPEE